MTTVTTIDETQAARVSALSGISWGAVIAGAIASVAVSLVLLAFGTGVGFSVISPWADSGVSATTFKIGSCIYLVIVAVLSSTIGGMLAGRLRSRWLGVHNDEIYFRDTAHGFLAWALALLLMAGVAGAAISHVLSGAAGAASSAAGATANPNAMYVDSLLRTDPTAANSAAAPTPLGAAAGTASTGARGNNNAGSRAEVGRIFTASMRKGGFSGRDRTYVAQVVSARTGLSQADAEKRVDQTVADAKKAADDARKAAATLALWLAAAMVAGALSAGLAATEGGIMRDTRWYEPGWRKTNARSQYMS